LAGDCCLRATGTREALRRSVAVSHRQPLVSVINGPTEAGTTKGGMKGARPSRACLVVCLQIAEGDSSAPIRATARICRRAAASGRGAFAVNTTATPAVTVTVTVTTSSAVSSSAQQPPLLPAGPPPSTADQSTHSPIVVSPTSTTDQSTHTHSPQCLPTTADQSTHSPIVVSPPSTADQATDTHNPQCPTSTAQHTRGDRPRFSTAIVGIVVSVGIP